MTKTEFYSEFESLLELDPGSIQGTELLADITGWDSIGILLFIALADEKLGVVMEPDKLVACRTMADLVGLFPGKITST